MRLKIALTGAGGFFNSRLLKSYEAKYEMIPLTRSVLDITNAGETTRMIKNIKPDLIVHGAAVTSTADCEEQPELAYTVNVAASLNLAKAARETKAKMIFLSSEQVFNGNIEDGPYREEQPACPNTVYGKTKLAAENLLKNELEQLWILRLSWLFGLPERKLPAGTNLFWRIVQACLTGIPVKVPVNEYRGITYVYDIIDHFDKILEIPYGIYHLSSINTMSTYQTAVSIMAQMRIKQEQIAKMIIPDYEKYKDQKRDLRLECNKIKAAGIPVFGCDASIERAVADYGLKLD